MRISTSCCYFRTGGVHQDIDDSLINDIYDFCDPFLKVVDDLESLLTENRIFKQRNVDIGVVSKKDVLDWGLTGVMARGSGYNWDLRKNTTIWNPILNMILKYLSEKTVTTMIDI